MLGGAYPPTVQECVWTNQEGENRCWKVIADDSTCKSFHKDGIAQGHNLPSVPMHKDKKRHRKKKGRKWKTSSEDARKEEEPARRDQSRP